MRRVRQVERLHPELDGPAAAKAEFAEDAHVEVGEARPAHAVDAGGAEPPLGDGAKCRRVEPRLARPDAAKNLDLVLHLVGKLGAAGQVQ